MPAAPAEPSNWPPIQKIGKSELDSSFNENRNAVPPVPIAEGGVQKYDLKQFLAAVLARNPGIVSAQLDAAADDYAYHSARVAYFPKLTATGRTGYIRARSSRRSFSKTPG